MMQIRCHPCGDSVEEAQFENVAAQPSSPQPDQGQAGGVHRARVPLLTAHSGTTWSRMA
jgi:hypothetical protein